MSLFRIFLIAKINVTLQLTTVNMTLPAFAAERRAAARATAAQLPATGLCQSYSSAATTGQIDGQTDGHHTVT